MFAIALTHFFNFSLDTIQNVIANFKPIKHRLNLYYMPNNVMYIDDSFNSSPESMIAAIDVLAAIGTGKKIAILCWMPDQENNIAGYKMIGRHIANKSIDFLYTVGTTECKEAAIIGEESIAAGFNPKHVQFCPDQYELIKALSKINFTNCTILAKGYLTFKLITYVKIFSGYQLNSPFRQRCLNKLSNYYEL